MARPQARVPEFTRYDGFHEALSRARLDFTFCAARSRDELRMAGDFAPQAFRPAAYGDLCRNCEARRLIAGNLYLLVETQVLMAVGTGLEAQTRRDMERWRTRGRADPVPLAHILSINAYSTRPDLTACANTAYLALHQLQLCIGSPRLFDPDGKPIEGMSAAERELVKFIRDNAGLWFLKYKTWMEEHFPHTRRGMRELENESAKTVAGLEARRQTCGL